MIWCNRQDFPLRQLLFGRVQLVLGLIKILLQRIHPAALLLDFAIGNGELALSVFQGPLGRGQHIFRISQLLALIFERHIQFIPAVSLLLAFGYNAFDMGTNLQLADGNDARAGQYRYYQTNS